MSRRLSVLRVNIFILVVIILGITVGINFLSSRHHKRFDFTATGKNTLADATVKVLGSLKSPLKMILFDKVGTGEQIQGKTLLELFRYNSPLVSFELIDPDQNASLAAQYEIHRYGTLVLEMGKPGVKDFKRQSLEGAVNEEAVTNAIIKLTRQGMKTIYFLEGHGEKDIDVESKESFSLLRREVEKQNYVARKLVLLRETQVPQDCSVLVVAGPKNPLLPEEEKLIDEYLDKGGKTLFMLDPPPAVGMKEFMAKYGVEVGDNMIIDKMSRLFGGDNFTPVITAYNPSHRITRDFAVASFFPMARSVTPLASAPTGAKVESLATTCPNSWATARIQGTDYNYKEGEDKPGPISVVVVAEIIKPVADAAHDKAGKVFGRLVVFGNSNFVNNTYLNTQSGNRDLLLNAISWLADEEGLISIRPKSDQPRTISLTADQMRYIFYFSVILLPVLALTAGISVWLRRRRA